jgi:release factor glutamine methyltransferase
MSAAPAPSPTVWTVRALLAWTADYFKSKGFESGRLEAQILLAHVLSCPRIELVARSDEVPEAKARATFRELVTRRAAGWPVAYLTGEREFYLLKFDVSPAVLIPRPETETLVQEALTRLKGRPAPVVLDLGTGSGCVAVSIAHQNKAVRVTAVDVSPDAAEVARRNAARHGVVDRVTVLVGDLFAPLPPGSAFDLVVSNPPYVTTKEWESLPVDVREHEPRGALDGGPDGLAFYRRIAAGAAAVLKPDGAVMVEIGATQEDAVRAVFAEKGFTTGPAVKDLARRPRVVVATR